MRKILRPLILAVSMAGVAAVGLASGLAPAQAITVGGWTETKVGANIAIAHCSGTLVNSKWVISAWHCFAGKKVSDQTGRWGNLNWAKGNEVRVVEVCHRYDIAVVQVKPALPKGAAVSYPKLGDADRRSVRS